MTSSRPFPPFIAWWSPLQRSGQPLRPWLTGFWQAPSHHSKQFAHLCTAKHIGQLALANTKRQTHESVTYWINKIACLKAKVQLPALRSPLANPHVVIAVNRNRANAASGKLAATARDAPSHEISAPPLLALAVVAPASRRFPAARSSPARSDATHQPSPAQST